MAKITIDGKEYDTDNLSDVSKANLASLQFVNNNITKLEAEIAVNKTAQAAYSQALKNELNND
tara:strand:+ start:240 stop:428 length:189 start_codon:yes stop_codon:yes gene_type:complete